MNTTEKQIVPEPCLLVDKLQLFLGKYKDAIKSGHGDTMTCTWALSLERIFNQEIEEERNGLCDFLVDHYMSMRERDNPDVLSLFAIILSYEMRYKIKGLRERCLPLKEN